MNRGERAEIQFEFILLFYDEKDEEMYLMSMIQRLRTNNEEELHRLIR